jgi:putative transposase
MSTPKHRTAIAASYFVTTRCWQGRHVFQVPEVAQLFVETLLDYRARGAYQLHEFVLMPDHFHLMVTPSSKTSLEKVVQLIKGGSSHRIHKVTDSKMPMWQEGFYDWTIRDTRDWDTKAQYIRTNPLRAKLASSETDWPYSSASGQFEMDPAPQKYMAVPSGAKAPKTDAPMAGLKPRPPEKNSRLAVAGSKSCLAAQDPRDCGFAELASETTFIRGKRK